MPPAISTKPFFSNVAVCQSRGVLILPLVYEKDPVKGLYSSPPGSPAAPPPSINTMPLFSSVAKAYGAVMLPVGVKLPVAGLYNSAVGREGQQPPATSTIPLFSSVAV